MCWSILTGSFVASIRYRVGQNVPKQSRIELLPFCLLTLFLLVADGNLASAKADEFILKSGGRLYGKLLNPKENPRKVYSIELENGGFLSLENEMVVQVVKETLKVKKYNEELKNHENTVEGHWEMSDWAAKNRMGQQQQFHLEQIIALESDHEGARKKLGYKFKDGKWYRPADQMKAKGMVKVGSKWLTLQAKQIADEKSAQKGVASSWNKKIRQIQKNLFHRREQVAATALAELRAIEEGAAAPAVVNWFKNETNQNVQFELIRLLGKINTPLTLSALSEYAILSPSAEVRDRCLDELARLDAGNFVKDGYLDYINKGNNLQINRAAYALGRLGVTEAVVPLILALNTDHTVTVKKARQGSTNVGFDNQGGGGLSVGSRKPLTEVKTYKNREVLAALRKLVEYPPAASYNEALWLDWFEKKSLANYHSLRRGR
ncbi:MAG: hypothetical protein MPJ24_08640 [Pirellulaceae bacterium]|nr:hypothetical protein [Pirellulaceae bacterium]